MMIIIINVEEKKSGWSKTAVTLKGALTSSVMHALHVVRRRPSS